MSTIYDEVNTEADFLNFVEALRQDLLDDPDSWANPDLALFLSAICGYGWSQWVDPELVPNRPSSIPTWERFAGLLLMAKIYE